MKKLSFLLIIPFIICGCAAIIHGSRQDVAVNSSPSGAKVVIMGVHKATTPAVIELKRSDNNIILRFEKEGFESLDFALTRKVDGWIIGNIVFGGLIGLVVDFATGSAYKISPEEVNITLQKSSTGFDNINKNIEVFSFEIKEIP